MIDALDQLSERFAGQLPESPFGTVREQLELVRDRHRAQLVGSALDARAVQELGAVRLRVDDWKLTQGGWKAIDSGLLRSYQRGRKAFVRAQADRSLEDLHAWRKRVKDLWYQQRLLGASAGRRSAGMPRTPTDRRPAGRRSRPGHAARNLTQGEMHVAIDLDAVIGLIDHRRDELQGRCDVHRCAGLRRETQGFQAADAPVLEGRPREGQGRA